jgi:hypothetical protein
MSNGARFYVNATNDNTTINTELTINGKVYGKLTIYDGFDDKFILDTQRNSLFINTDQLKIDLSNNLSIDTKQLLISSSAGTFATFVTTYLGCSKPTLNDISNAFIQTDTGNGYASLFFKIGTNQNINSKITSTTDGNNNSLLYFNTQALKMVTSGYGNPLVITKDQITMAGSSYALNTTTFNTGFTFTGGTGSNIKFIGSSFQFSNANYISGLNIAPSTSYPAVINASTVINGDLIVTGSIKSDITGEFLASQIASQAYNQFQTRGLNTASIETFI